MLNSQFLASTMSHYVQANFLMLILAHMYTYKSTYGCENEKWLQLNWESSEINSEFVQSCSIERDLSIHVHISAT